MASQRGSKSSPKPKALPDSITYLLIGSCILIIPLVFSNHTIDPTQSHRFTILSLSLILIGLLLASAVALLLAIVCVGIIGRHTLKRFSVLKRYERRFIIRLIISAVLFFALGAFGYFSKSRLTQQPLKNEVVSAANLGESSIQVRLKMWNKTLSTITDHPIFGVGLGNWKVIIPSYGTHSLPSENGKVQYLRPQNDFLWVGAEIGLLGLFSYLALFGISIYYLLGSLDYSRDLTESIFRLTLVFGVIGFLVISFFSFPKERVAHFIFINVILAITLMKYHQKYDTKKRFTSFPLVPALIIPMIILASSVILGLNRIPAEVYPKKRHTTTVKNNNGKRCLKKPKQRLQIWSIWIRLLHLFPGMRDWQIFP